MREARQRVLRFMCSWILGICEAHPLCARQLAGEPTAALRYVGRKYRKGALTARERAALGPGWRGASEIMAGGVGARRCGRARGCDRQARRRGAMAAAGRSR